MHAVLLDGHEGQAGGARHDTNHLLTPAQQQYSLADQGTRLLACLDRSAEITLQAEAEMLLLWLHAVRAEALRGSVLLTQ